jgi:hypothetical protein
MNGHFTKALLMPVKTFSAISEPWEWQQQSVTSRFRARTDSRLGRFDHLFWFITSQTIKPQHLLTWNVACKCVTSRVSKMLHILMCLSLNVPTASHFRTVFLWSCFFLLFYKLLNCSDSLDTLCIHAHCNLCL